MEINMNNGNLGFTSVGGSSESLGAVAASETSVSDKAARVSPSLTISKGAVALGEASIPVDAAKVEPTRDDPLGKLVNSVFNLPPPPMPDFS